MKKLGLFLLCALSACQTIEETAADIEEAVGKTGAALMTAPHRRSLPSTVEDRRLEQIGEFFLNWHFRLQPARATRAGLHKYDGEIGLHTKAQFDEALDGLKQLSRDIDLIHPPSLSGSRSIEHSLIRSRILGTILQLEEVRPQYKNPNYYLNLITQGAFSLTSRDFAPKEERATSLTERMQAIPAVLSAARQNIQNPPLPFVEVAIENTTGAIDFFKNSIKEEFPEFTMGTARKEFLAAHSQAIEELESYRMWMDKVLRANAHGSYALGMKTFQKKLLYDEMVETPVRSLLLRGKEELNRLEEMATEAAAKAYPGMDLRDAFEALGRDHGKRTEILEETRNGLAELRQFCQDHYIVGFPAEEVPVVQETPAFMRALTFASMDSPGAFEKNSKTAFYNVTLPTADMPEEKQAKLLEFFNHSSLPIVSIHEVYPGHFTQFLWVKNAPTKWRKLLGARSNAEGWAHYAEEMMLDEGYGNNDPKLRLAQIQHALVRACRYVAGIQMHTGRMTLTEATNFFMARGFLSRPNAFREARRGTMDPTYLVYTLGKMMIKKLREDCRQFYGTGFVLGDFHNAFLAAGYPPIPLVREILLPELDQPNL